jgi:hypothetical protein
MRMLAQYATRGHREAALVAIFTALIPLLFWFSAAIVALVILRKGTSAGLKVLFWASLPGLMWQAGGDPVPLLTLLGVASLAVVLRQTVNWPLVLLVALLVGFISNFIMVLYLQPALAAIGQMFEELALQNEAGSFSQQLQVLQTAGFDNAMVGFFGATHLAMLLASLVLARWWQACLFNPGGWQVEFHQLRLPLWFGGLLVLLVFGVGNLFDLSRWVPMLTVPLLFAALALVHGSVGKLNLGWPILLLFYLATILFGPVIFNVLVFSAVADSVLDFRQRLSIRQ